MTIRNFREKNKTSKLKKQSEDSQIYQNRIEDVKSKKKHVLGKTGSRYLSPAAACDMVLDPIPTSTFDSSHRCRTVLLSSWSRSSTFHHGAKDKDQIWKLIFKDLNKFDVFLYVFNSLFTKLENPQHRMPTPLPPRHGPLQYPISLPNANARKRPSASSQHPSP